TLVAGDPSISSTNPSSPTTTVTGVPAGESATLRWTISNGTCADSFDEIILTNHAPPSTANAGLDQENCNDGNFILNANTPVSGTGTWTVISGGPSVTVVDPSDPDSDVTGVPAGVTAVLRWTISNGTCADSFDEVELTNYALPTIADAGDPEIEQCNNGTFLLNANTPDVGTGTWTLVAGDPGINITNPSSPTTTVTGVPAGESATLRWTISNGTCADSFDEIILTNHAPPSTADAGLDQENCNDGNFTLAAATPLVGTGTWSLVSGSASIDDLNDPQSDVSGVAPGASVTLQWRVDNGTCAPSVDQVVLTNHLPPTTADAGLLPEIEQCNNGIFLMSANTPSVGTGLWTLEEGAPSVSITNPSLPATTVVGIPAGDFARLRWTISNGTCADSFDEIILTNHEPPSNAAAGPDQEQCNNGTFTMAATEPLVGIGTWSVVLGSASIADPNDHDTQVSGVAPGTSVTLEWRVENGNCADKVDQVVLTNSAMPDVADAGDPVIEQCNNGTFFMSANTPITGTGSWQLISGSANIVNIN